ncbi:MAG: histidine--tRNA ligase [Candidatus Paceibacterota bacterium]
MPKSIKHQKNKVVRKGKKEKKTLFQSPKGMHDILPQEQPYWEKIRRVSNQIADFYNFSRIDTPILEMAEIFERGIGEGTDIIEKQMFTIRTKGGDRLVLRPEGTAPIIRSYLQHGLSRLSQPMKLYYNGPMFRYEKPQAGRYRQFHQVGFETIGGDDDPIFDAQIILITYQLIKELKIKNLTIQINSIGCKNCRPAYRRKLQSYYNKFGQNEICKDCQRRLVINPLRLLDCKNENCALIREQAPILLNNHNLCQSCNNHFKETLEFIDELKLPYNLNPFLVRGLDYYNRTVFEIFTEGVNVALASGGRYDYLAEMLGSRKRAAVGSSIGIERLVEVMKTQGFGGLSIRSKPKAFLIHIGEQAKKQSLGLIEEFRKSGIKVIESLWKDSLKSQLRVADKEEATLSLILGQKEVFEESIIIRDMRSGAQETVPLRKAVEEVKKRLK